jgi:competence protein ComEA
MAPEKLNRLWLAATFLLIVIIITSSVIIWIKHDPGQPIAISSPSTADFQANIFIDGAVNNPGIYPLKSTDDLNSLIQASGGTNADADLSTIHLYIPAANENPQSQRIDINRAEIWLLEALPDVGLTRAQAIIDYRQQRGPFKNIQEITQVPGISASTFNKIKDLITVAE